MKTGRKIRTVMGIAAGRLTRRLLRLTGKGGTALPGKAAMLFDREILRTVSRGMHVIAVTGTNGKTTTCRVLENAVKKSGKACLLNRSGANLLSGITAEFVCSASLLGKPRVRYAVIECDEGALKQAAPLLQPEVIVVTNLFRDQLDRYGEVMNTREQILAGIEAVPDSILCLNADDPLTATMAEKVRNRTVFYGIDVPVGSQEKRELSDAKYCVDCGTEYEYSYYTYAHLGGFRCPKCGCRRPEPAVAVTAVTEQTSSASRIRLRTRKKGQERAAVIGLPAVYNLYNAAAALCGGLALGLPEDSLLEACAGMEACFGRMEDFRLGDVDIRMILVKNPAGCNQAMEYIEGCGEEYGLVFCLNDRTADGHDISWIWDAEPERIIKDLNRKAVYVSGDRAEDMQLRLKYAGAAEEEILLEKDWGRLIRHLAGSPRRIFILPNYTAMLTLRRELLKVSGGEAFWKG